MSSAPFNWKQPAGRALETALNRMLALDPDARTALRALDGRNEGKTYRAIAEGIFGKKRIPEHAWKTHDLRNRTIRLVQRGLALMWGGYRDLLRPRRKDK